MIFDLPLDKDFSLKIGAHVWKVRFVEELPSEDHYDMWGSCCFQTLTISVVRREDLDYSMVLSTFFHEVLHAYEYTYNVRMSHKDLNIIGELLADMFLGNFWKTSEGKDE